MKILMMIKIKQELSINKISFIKIKVNNGLKNKNETTINHILYFFHILLIKYLLIHLISIKMNY